MEPRNQSWFFLSFLFILISIVTDPSSATDTINAGQSLTLKQTLISKGGRFELGFFSPGDSRKYYLGIWYKEISVVNRTYVWVANREAPLRFESSFELKLSKDGNLALLNESKHAVWSSNTTTNAMNPSQGVLGDDGNFILGYGVTVTHFDVYWQSFDYPSDTFLPGSMLRYDKIAQKPQPFISWKSADDPSPGLFSVGMEAVGDQFSLRWNRSETYWSSGPWNGKIFRDIPMMKLGYIFNYTYFKNANESYFTYRLYNNSIISRILVDVSGQIKQFSWDAKRKQWFLFWDVPIQQCDVFGFCGAYGVCNQNVLPFCTCMKGFRPGNQNEWDVSDFSSSGCVRKSPLQCGVKDAFRTIPNVNLPQKPEPFSAANIDECKLACSKNCSCKAYAYRSLCLIWSGDLFSVQQFSGAYEGGGDLFLKLAAVDIEDTPALNNTVISSDISKGRNHGLATWIIVGAVAGLVLLGLTLSCLALKKRMLSKKVAGSFSKSQKESLELPIFDLHTIETATDNFSVSNRIGRGGFGPVYKGLLPTGEEIAIKRLSKESRQGINEFMNEVILIAKLQHRNLVRLLGCCIEGDERMLIYEYMPNKSLDFFIFDKTRNNELNWKQRFDIIVGIARGLLYLHQDSRLRIIHRDLKAANVLLDNKMNAKISDFGLARILGGDLIEQRTMSVVGTYGYMSPEYATDGMFSTKSDVFSYGVLVLEIISGQRNRGFHHADHDLNLLGHIWNLLKDNNTLDILDPLILESLTIPEVLKCIKIGLLCVQKFPGDRPTMATVLSMLDSDGATLPCPKEPGFYTERSPLKKGDSVGRDINFISNNEVTNTLVEGR